MLSQIHCASIAVVASDDDMHVFFEYVFEDEFDMQLFFDHEFKNVLESQDRFAYVLMDIPSALRMMTRGCWDSFYKVFSDRFYFLLECKQIENYERFFGKDIKTIPYPFTKRDFYSYIDKEKLSVRPKEKQSESPNEKEMNDGLKFNGILQFARLLGCSKRINEARRKILMVADTDLPILFYGESGTGKTLAAKIAHELSLRKDKPFVVANMANARSDFIESVLFGNVRGAFTDARDRDGLFKKADGGTLFMDEIADLSLECQAKLLRVIESGVFRPIGSDEERKADVRLMFATNADLGVLVRKKLFREDLYWRIVDFPIEVPALRDRVEDFPLLIEKELNEIKEKSGKTFSITQEAVQKMSGYDWPGNFRQFKSCLRRAAVLSRDTGTIDCEAISF